MTTDDAMLDAATGPALYFQRNMLHPPHLTVQRSAVNGGLYMATEITGQVGPAAYNDGDRERVFRQGRTGELLVSQVHGRYYEQASRGNIFSAANPTTQAISVKLATAYTGVCLSNPAGSGKNLGLLAVGFSITAAPGGIFGLGLMGGFGAVTHTAALIVNTTAINGAMTASSNLAVGLADSQATIPTPVYLAPLQNGVASAALPVSTANIHTPIEALFVIPPGGFIALYAFLAGTGNGFMAWEEVPI